MTAAVLRAPALVRLGTGPPERPERYAGRRHCLTGLRGPEYITAAPEQFTSGAIRPSPGV